MLTNYYPVLLILLHGKINGSDQNQPPNRARSPSTAPGIVRSVDACQSITPCGHLRQFLALAEHPAVSPCDPHALDFFRVGCHHRIVAHAARVGWLAWNQIVQWEG